nr:capsid protein [Rat picobirnavirus]
MSNENKSTAPKEQDSAKEKPCEKNKQQGNKQKDYKNKGKKKNQKGQDRESKQEKKQNDNHEDKPKKDQDRYNVNDYRFYAYDEQIAKDIGSIPYALLAGAPAPFQIQSGPSSNAIDNSIIGSIAQINYACVPGVTTSKASGVNMAAVQLYTYIRHENSGAKNYEAADVMMYILAMSDIYAHAIEAKRALATASYIPIVNKSFPDVALQVMGFDAADIRGNFAQYRGRLNLLISKLNSFAVPSYFKVFSRRGFIAANIFGDSDSERGQFYIYRRYLYYTWDTTSSTSGTQLTPHPVSTVDGVITLGSFLDQLDQMLSSMFLDTDALTMSGDILKAFPNSELFKMDYLTEDTTLRPILDEDALAQIENMVTASSYYLGDSMDWLSTPAISMMTITQSNQIISFNPVYTYSNGSPVTYCMRQYVFNSHKVTPDYRDTLEWSRCMTMPKIVRNSTTNSGGQIGWSFGCEFITKMELFTYNRDGDGVVMKHLIAQLQTGNSSTMTVGRMALLDQYDWHPFIYEVGTPGTSAMFIGGDMKMYARVDFDTINAIHDVANASVFYFNGYNQMASKVKR